MPQGLKRAIKRLRIGGRQDKPPDPDKSPAPIDHADIGGNDTVRDDGTGPQGHGHGRGCFVEPNLAHATPSTATTTIATRDSTAAAEKFSVDFHNLWDEALSSVDSDTAAKVKLFATQHSQNPKDQKSLVLLIEKDLKLGADHEQTTTRRRIENAVFVLNRFANVVDVAVQYDPVHAALPWAAVRFVLTGVTAIIDLKNHLMATMADVIALLGRCDMYKDLYTSLGRADGPPAGALSSLRECILSSYTRIQMFLAWAMGCKSAWASAVAAFKLPDLEGHASAISDRSVRLQRAADDCQKTQISQFLEIMENRDAREMEEWISKVRFGQHHDIFSHNRMSETCEWLLKRDDFREWEEADSPVFLWLQGQAGAGKSFLTSRVIDRIAEQLKVTPGQQGFAYFYCNRNEQDRRDPTSVLQSYVRQLASPHAAGPLTRMRARLHEVCRSTRSRGSMLSLEQCEDQILESINLYSRTTIVLDALDECEPMSRLKLVKILVGLLSKSTKPLKIFVASRPDPDIRQRFLSRPNIEIQATDNRQDIATFVETEMSDHPRWEKMAQSFRDTIISTLVDRSNGMFQWANLQVKQLSELTTQSAIKDRLGKLPPTLSAAYEEIYKKRSSNPHEKLIVDSAIKWVMCADTPFGTRKLAGAISGTMADETPEEYDEDMFRRLTNNLLVLDSELDVWRFAHLSVRQYFEDHRWDLREANCHAAKICLSIFLRPTLPPQPNLERDDLIDSSLFEHYAFYGWIWHTRDYDQQTARVGNEADEALSSHLKSFLGYPDSCSERFRYWFDWSGRQYEVTEQARMKEYQEYRWPSCPNGAVVYMMARFHFYTVLRDWWHSEDIGTLIKRSIIDLNKSNRSREIHETPLSIAAYYGHVVLCKALCEGGMDVNHVLDRSEFYTPLVAGIASRSLEVAEVLLKHGANVNQQIPSGYRSDCGSALEFAVDELLNLEAVKLLVAMGADVNLLSSFGDYGSALVATASSSHYDSEERRMSLEIVDFLVSQGVDANLVLSVGRYGSALAAAAAEGNLEISKFLVRQKADVNLVLSAGEYGSALAAAAAEGSFAVLEFLIEQGADVDLMLSTGAYGIALVAAAAEGNLEATRFLVKRGADVNLMPLGGFYGSALAAAAHHSHDKDLLEFLVEQGADVDPVPIAGHFGSPLAAAAASPRGVESVMYLVEQGANVNRVFIAEFCGSALEASAYEGAAESVDFLLARGADVNLLAPLNDANADACGSALCAAAYWGRPEIVTKLLEAGAEVNMRVGHTSFNNAIQAARAGMESWLSTSRPAYKAKVEGCKRVVDILIRYGATEEEAS